MTLNEYARAIAEAVGRACMANWRIAPDAKPVDLDAIIATTPAPDVQAQDKSIEEVLIDNGQCPCLLCCEHDIGHEGPHTYDVQAQIDAAVKAAVAPWLEEEKLWREELDAAVAREREAAIAEAFDVVKSVTGPTGGWIASPREVYHSIAREIRARSGAKGEP